MGCGRKDSAECMCTPCFDSLIFMVSLDLYLHNTMLTMFLSVRCRLSHKCMENKIILNFVLSANLDGENGDESNNA